MTDIKEKELLKRLHNGEIEVFWQIWAGYEKQIWGYCLRLLNNSVETAEDAKSASMLKAYEKLPDNLNKIYNLKAWLFQVVRNTCIDQYRRNQKEVAVEEIYEKASDEKSSPDNNYFYHNVITQLFEEIENLPGKQRKVIILSFLYDVSYRDIAEQLDISYANARKRLQYALTVLRKKMEQYNTDRAELFHYINNCTVDNPIKVKLMEEARKLIK